MGIADTHPEVLKCGARSHGQVLCCSFIDCKDVLRNGLITGHGLDNIVQLKNVLFPLGFLRVSMDKHTALTKYL